MPIYPKLRVGDAVFYRGDPRLFGEMEVRAVKGMRVVCIVDPDSADARYEDFGRAELWTEAEAVAKA